MTFTYNGVGTRYVGNKNQVDRGGECPWCHKSTRMSSYDTRLWFVVLFVPIIPLQKLRILDQCARCTRHKKVSYAKWIDIQSEASNRAGALLQTRRDDPAAAIEAHRTLLGVDLTLDAEALAQVMATRFDGSADVHVYLADLAALRGRPIDARAGYARAHELEPNHTAAREGLALAELGSGRLERAHELLKPVIAAGTARNPVACCSLAESLARVGRQSEAHAILMSMLELFPTLGSSKIFKKQLHACEKKLGTQRTKLTRRLEFARPLIVGAVVLMLAAIGFVAADRVAAAHQTLHVVDSIGGRLEVDIPGLGSLTFDDAGRQTLDVSEGTFTAHVKGAVERDVQFTVACSRWPCFLSNDVFVLDASGGSVVSLRTALYTPRGDSKAPRRRYVPMHDFARFDRIDYVFEREPNEILLGKQGYATREVIELPEGRIESVVYEMAESGKARDAFDLAQTRLKLEPSEIWMLYAYVSAAQRAHMEQNAENFIEPRLQSRPLDMDAHRAWIQLRSRAGGWKAAAERYDELMEREPDETAWVLLRALVSESSSRKAELFRRVVQDEKFACGTWMLLAGAESSCGNWQAALDAARHAQACDEDEDGEATSFVYEALAALGRTEELEVLLDQALAQYACDWEALSWRAQLLAGEKSAVEAADALEPFLQTAAKADPKQAAVIKKDLARVQAWARGDFAAVVKQAAAQPKSNPKLELMMALAEQGSMHELAKWCDTPEGFKVDASTALGLALACRAHDDVSQAKHWEHIALSKLPGFGGSREAAFLLQGRRVGVAEKAFDLDMAPPDKAIVLALLACSDEKSRAALLTQALALQPRYVFPRATIEQLAAGSIKR